jgi:hypothetical protein
MELLDPADETFGLPHMCESLISRDRGWVTKSSQFYKTTITFVEVVWENKIKVQTYANFRIFLVPSMYSFIYYKDKR